MANAGQAAIKIYFEQTDHYFSAKKGTLVKLTDMDPAYAANAARVLLQDARSWAAEADADTQHSARWMLGTPLFLALQARAAGDGQSALSCPDCPYTGDGRYDLALHRGFVHRGPN